MTALLVVDLKVKDREKLKQYGSKTPAMMATFNGSLFAKGPIERLHGTDKFETKVIFEFPNSQFARDWYNSSDYQSIVPLRDEAIESSFHLLESELFISDKFK